MWDLVGGSVPLQDRDDFSVDVLPLSQTWVIVVDCLISAALLSDMPQLFLRGFDAAMNGWFVFLVRVRKKKKKEAETGFLW